MAFCFFVLSNAYIYIVESCNKHISKLLIKLLQSFISMIFLKTCDKTVIALCDVIESPRGSGREVSK